MVDIRGTVGDDIIFGFESDDSIFGDDGDDELHGGDGNDGLIGHTGNDLINGNAGNDKIAGFWGNDTLNGNEGNDLLDGGDGIDILTGGAGRDFLFGGPDRKSDVFRFESITDSSGRESDVIFDFEVGIDKLDFSGLVSEGITDFSDLNIMHVSFSIYSFTFMTSVSSNDNFGITFFGNLDISDADFIF